MYFSEINPDHMYYEIMPHEYLEDLLGNPEKYKLCSIKLDGSQRAKCTTVDTEVFNIIIIYNNNKTNTLELFLEMSTGYRDKPSDLAKLVVFVRC